MKITEILFGGKICIDTFNYLKKISSKKLLFILLILMMVWFIAAMCKVINYNSKKPLINVIQGISKLTDGKKQYHKVREDCGLNHTILLSGFIQRMDKYKKVDKSICLKYDFVCKEIINIFSRQEQQDNYGFTFLTLFGLNDKDRYDVKRSVILNNKTSNYFMKSLIDRSINNNNRFIYFTREQVFKECPEFAKVMFGLSVTKDTKQVSFLLQEASLVNENGDSPTSYIFVAFVNENEVKNIKCKNDYYIQDLLDIVINNHYKNSFINQ